jgi:hypothetical protein
MQPKLQPRIRSQAAFLRHSLYVQDAHRERREVRAMRRVVVISTVAAVVLAGALTSAITFWPSATRAAPRAETSAVALGRCPRGVLPLPAEAVARAADQARIQAPALYKGFGPAVVELAWLAKLRLNVWAAAPFHCSSQVRDRTVVVDLLFPKMLPSASLSAGVVFVSLFRTGYQVWQVAH